MAHNPYPSTYSQPTVSAGVDNPQVIRMAKIDRLFKMLDSHPLTKNSKVWATEFGWETTGPGKISEARQAQFIAESFDFLDSKRRVELGISYGLTDPKDLNDWQSGTYRPNGVAKLAVKMMQRMVSVPKAGTTNKVKRGTIVRVWGRSNVSPKTGVLAYTIPGKKCKPGFVWCLVPKQKRAFDGSIVASMKIMQPKITFATYDAGNAVAGIKAGYGYPRAISSY